MWARKPYVFASTRATGALIQRVIVVHRYQDQRNILATMATQPHVEWGSANHPGAIFRFAMKDALHKAPIDGCRRLGQLPNACSTICRHRSPFWSLPTCAIEVTASVSRITVQIV